MKNEKFNVSTTYSKTPITASIVEEKSRNMSRDTINIVTSQITFISSRSILKTLACITLIDLIPKIGFRV